MAILSKEALLEASVPTDEVEIPSKNGSVLVRALTRGQVHANSEARDKGKKSNKDIEAQTLVWGLVEPALDVTEVKAWMDSNSTDEVNRVVTRIMELSGFDETDQKEAAKSLRNSS
jgi:hypothetical protein